MKIQIFQFFRNFNSTLRWSFIVGIIAVITVTKVFIGDSSHYEESGFNSHIVAFTSGRINKITPIIVEFQHDIATAEKGVEVSSEIFLISPSLKGSAYWKDSRTIEFVPQMEDIQEEKNYQGVVQVDKLIDGVSVGESRFVFSFSYFPLSGAIIFYPLEPLNENNSKWNKMYGVIEFSELVKEDLSDGSKVLEVKGNGRVNDGVVITKKSDNQWSFVIDSIERIENDYTLEVMFVDPRIKLKEPIKNTRTIRSESFFGIESVELNGSNSIQIVFSSPLLRQQSIEGLVQLSQISNYNLNKEGNIVTVTFENTGSYTNVNVTISKEIRSSNNQTMKNDYRTTVTIKENPPTVSFLNNGNILPQTDKTVLVFKANNLNAVDVRIIKIFTNNILHFLQTQSINGEDNLNRSGKLIVKKKIILSQSKSADYKKWQYYHLDLSSLIKDDPTAIYRVELSFKPSYSTYTCSGDSKSMEDMETYGNEERFWEGNGYYQPDYPDNYWNDYDWRESDNPCHVSYYKTRSRFPATNVLVSNIGIVAKKGRGNNSYFITVTDLRTAEPLPGSEVELFTYQLQSVGKVTTDGSGFAEIKVTENPFILTAKYREQISYLKLATSEALSVSKFDVSGKTVEKGLKGYLYGERGVWRPGDSIYLFFMLEDKTKNLPDNHPVTLTVTTPTGQLAYRNVTSTSVNGVYAFHFTTSENAVTGNWTAAVSIGKTIFTKTLRVETIKPNRIKVSLTPSQSVLNKQQNIQINGTFLHGATASNLRTTVDVKFQPYIPQFKDFTGYNFSNTIEPIDRSTVQVSEQTLNNEGNTKVMLSSLDVDSKYGMLQANFTTRIFEQGGDFSTNVQSFVYSTAESYVGIKIPKPENNYYLETNKTHKFEVATVTAEGKATSRNLTLKIYKIDWYWWWERSGEEDLSGYVNSTSHKPLFTKAIKTQSGKGSYDFTLDYPAWGRYLVYIKDDKSGTVASETFYVDWGSEMNRSNRENPSGLSMLSFSVNKKSYQVGEEMVITFPQVEGGKILLSVENGSTVFSRQWITTSGKSDVNHRIKITKEHLPNIYIHVTLIQPYGNITNDLPIRMYGIEFVEVKDPTTVLQPQVKLPAVIRPGESFAVEVSEKTGQAMTYTLAIVDEGLLDLTNFKTPSPWQEFYARESLGVNTWDMYKDVMGASQGVFPQLLSIGGDQDLQKNGDDDKKLGRFKPVVKVLGPFTINKNKTEKHKITIDNYVGSVRAMVVARQNESYGNAETTAPVRNPLMILTSLPRVLSINETVAIPINIFAMEKEIKNVEITLSNKGLVNLEGDVKQSLKFSTIGDKMAYFTIKVGSKTGKEQIVVTATSGGYTAKEVINIDVRNPNPPIIKTHTYNVESNQKINFDYAKQSSDAHSEEWAKLEIARIPSIDLSRQLNYLINYPHGCSEQITSAAFPQLFLHQFINLTKEEKERITEHVSTVIKKLYTRQIADGGISYWDGEQNANDWITNYAGHFLLEAKKAGYHVTPACLENWRKYQRQQANKWRLESTSSRYYDQGDLLQAYRLYTLALYGTPEIGAMNRMKEQMSKLSIQAKWRLAAGYAIAGKEKVADDIVANITTTIPAYSPYNNTYGSVERDQAMMIETLLLLNDKTRAFPLIKELVKSISKGYVYSTQTIAYSLLTMSNFARTTSGKIEGKLLIDGKDISLGNTTIPIIMIDLPLKKRNTVEFINSGKEMIFVTFTHRYTPQTDTAQAQQNMLSMEVNYFDRNNKKIDVGNLKKGEVIRCEVRVGNSSGLKITDLALTQIFPAGWEIVNERLYEEKSTTSTMNYQDIRDDRVYTYFDLSNGKVQTITTNIIATYGGRYFLPAVYCEAMYDSQTFSRSEGKWIEVK